MKLLWTQQALERLLEIQQYVEGNTSAGVAAKLIKSLIRRAENLPSFPYMGRIVPEFYSENLREIIEGKYRIVYSFQKDTVFILTIFEGHRLFPEKDLLVN
ncbi:MAG: type II toxin-antitoxin system RelE/ParE family toxin [Proteobacteria bacterium]|nr:type II toxin-antitoxin system RelE/ParE family toxin [Pseudomonadota bacterium]